MSLASCASMFNGSRQQVQFRGGVEKGITKVSSPDGTFEVENGQGSFMMTRTKSNIPLKITCPDGSKKSSTVDTTYDWATGWLNLFNYGFGFIEAATSDSAYKVNDVNLYNACKNS